MKTIFGLYLEKQGIKACFVARKIGMSPGAISNYCRKGWDGYPRRSPGTIVARKIAKLLQVNVDIIFPKSERKTN